MNFHFNYMIDPMTQQKKNEMEHKTMQYSCPFCSCSFKEHELIVQMIGRYKFNKKEKLVLKHADFDKIICNNCKNDITISLIEKFYEQSSTKDTKI